MNRRFPGARVIRPTAPDKARRPGGIHTGSEIHRAHWVMSRPDHIIENGYIRIENGMITEVSHINSCSALNSGSGSNSGPYYGSDHGTMVFDHGDGVIMPGLVNAHLHLELSALKGRLPFNRGFSFWVRELLKQREHIGEKILAKHAAEALKGLVDSGSLFAAEISTLGITKDIVKNDEFRGIWFKEMLGSMDSFDSEVFSGFDGGSDGAHLYEILGKSEAYLKLRCEAGQGQRPDLPHGSYTGCNHDPGHSIYREKINSPFQPLCFSLAGHAPHTSSPVLLKEIKRLSASKGLVFSIHAAESEDESEFITTAKGPWACFLKERGIDFSSWPIPASTPVEYLFRLGLLDPLTILVHLLNLNKRDLELIADSGAKPVLCPRSNMNLHARLPDIPGFLRMGLKPALGTDSLASCDSLSIFDEMAFVAAHFPDIPPHDIITMATINGASALGMEKTGGSLETGKTGDCIYLPLKTGSSADLLETIVSGSM